MCAGEGYLDAFTLEYFLREVCAHGAAVHERHGVDPVEMADVMDEIYDVLNVQGLTITLRDFLRVGATTEPDPDSGSHPFAGANKVIDFLINVRSTVEIEEEEVVEQEGQGLGHDAQQ